MIQMISVTVKATGTNIKRPFIYNQINASLASLLFENILYIALKRFWGATITSGAKLFDRLNTEDP
jgi:hypothetical protein